MTIATIYVSDERYAAQRPSHIHRQCFDETEAQEWVDGVEIRMGWIEYEITRLPSLSSWRCPVCGWLS